MPVKRNIKRARTLAIAKRVGLKGTLRSKKEALRNPDFDIPEMSLKSGVETIREFTNSRNRVIQQLADAQNKLEKTSKWRFIKRGGLKYRISELKAKSSAFGLNHAKMEVKREYAEHVANMQTKPKPRLP